MAALAVQRKVPGAVNNFTFPMPLAATGSTVTPMAISVAPAALISPLESTLTRTPSAIAAAVAVKVLKPV